MTEQMISGQTTSPPTLEQEVTWFLNAGHPDRAEIVNDPYPFFERLRNHDPVYKTAEGPWLITGAAECEQMLKDARFVRDVIDPDARLSHRVFLGSLVFLDAPDHTRIRRLTTPVFTPRAIEKRRQRTRAIVEKILGDLPNADTYDFRKYAFELPVAVICDFIGVPLEHGEDFARWAYYTRHLQEPFGQTEEQLREADEVAQRCLDFFNDLVEQRRVAPGDDLITQLLQAKSDEKIEISEEELVGLIVLLHVGGHSTTTEVLATGLHHLMLNPAVEAELRANLDLIPEFIEEVMRIDAPVVTALSRVATEPVVVGEHEIPAGERVYALITAANRDPRRYENPHDFDLHRPTRRHLAFGAGAHYCLGAHLAKQEVEEAFHFLFTQCPPMTHDGDPYSLPWTDHLLHRGLHSLPTKVATASA